uniref:CSON004393 protein n=1 Tax=Culicoides sonorensis TaxID=179676 RepID=A0A336LTP1_CULSO
MNPAGFENVISCPYNKSHQILPHRMQTHLTKCAKNYPEIKLEKCPFNITHRFSQADMEEHKKTCPDRANFDNYVLMVDTDGKMAEKLEKEKNFPKPFTPSHNSESWDDIESATYDPKKAALTKPVLRLNNGMTPSQRRAFREAERRRLNAIEQELE